MDGCNTVSGTDAGTVTAGDFSIGADYTGGSRFTGRIGSVLIFSTVLDVDELRSCPERNWLWHPSLYLAYNPSHVQDSAAPGGLIHDWTHTSQDITPTSMAANDIVADAP
jgi:hypothetical protein